MRNVVFVILFMGISRCFGQQVQLIKLDQLFERVQKGGDTTYVVNFWATWCVPCVTELPYFDKFAAEYKNEKLQVLLVSLDFRSKLNTVVIPFLKKRMLRPPVYLLDENDQQAYINRIDGEWSGALPATLIMNDKNKKFFEQEFTYDELVTAYKKFKL